MVANVFHDCKGMAASQFIQQDVHPKKTNSLNLKMGAPWKRKYLLDAINFRFHVSYGKKKLVTFQYTGWLMKGCLFHGLLKSLYNWVVFHPLHALNNQGPFFHCCSSTYRTQNPGLEKGHFHPGWGRATKGPC